MHVRAEFADGACYELLACHIEAILLLPVTVQKELIPRPPAERFTAIAHSNKLRGTGLRPKKKARTRASLAQLEHAQASSKLARGLPPPHATLTLRL